MSGQPRARAQGGPVPTLFTKRSAPISFDKDLGLCFGWFCFNKKDGEDYVDAHGDHFPGDELLKAVDSLMAKPASDREINVEHVGAGRDRRALDVAQVRVDLLFRDSQRLREFERVGLLLPQQVGHALAQRLLGHRLTPAATPA